VPTLEARGQEWLKERDTEENREREAACREATTIMDEEIQEVWAASVAEGQERMYFGEFKASFQKLKIFTDGKLGLAQLEDAKIAKIFDDLDVESGSNRNLTRADFLKFCHLIIFDAMLAEDAAAAPAADA